MKLFAVLVLFVCVGCGTSEAAPSCELGRVQSCPCSGGGQGTQECGPARVWSACVCAGSDAGSDAASDAAGDASGNALEASADVPPSDGGACVPACNSGQRCEAGRCVVDGDAATDADVADVLEDVPPPLYCSCEPVGMPCGEGMECRAVPVLVDAGSVRGVCTRSCASSAECPGRETRQAVCAGGGCFIEATDPRVGVDAARWCVPWGLTGAATSAVRAADSRSPNPMYTAYCVP